MSKNPQRSSPLSVRFTEAEKSRLKDLAGTKPLGEFIRERSLGNGTEPKARVNRPLKDAAPLGKLLGRLGQSQLASSLSQFAKAASQGSLAVTKETEDDLRAACAAVFEMRLLLLQALGIKIISEVQSSPALSVLDTDMDGGLGQ